MSTQEPAQVAAPTLTSLPRLEDLERTPEGGFADPGVREAFEAFRRHALQLQAQLRVLQAAAGTSKVEPTAHAVRMDALHLIRAAAEFADQIERDAQNASAVQLSRAEEEIRRHNDELQQRESEIDRFRQESDRQRADIVNQAKAEAREITSNAEREANQELREAEARAARLIEQSRHLGDRADERRSGRGRADARVGPRTGVGDHQSRPAWRRAAALGRRPLRGQHAARGRLDQRRRRRGGTLAEGAARPADSSARGRSAGRALHAAAGRGDRRRTACHRGGADARGARARGAVGVRRAT
jgi:hypothetical protein